MRVRLVNNKSHVTCHHSSISFLIRPVKVSIMVRSMNPSAVDHAFIPPSSFLNIPMPLDMNPPHLPLTSSLPSEALPRLL